MQQIGKYTVRFAETDNDVRLAQSMRAGQFGVGSADGTLDIDAFDMHCKHVLIEATDTSDIHACFRFMHIGESHRIDQSYSAQFYDLERLKKYGKPILEIGRFCLKSNAHDQGLLRIAWAFLTRYVDEHNIAFMFGCSSFEGIEQAKYTDAFVLLKECHLAPEQWVPQIKSSEVFEFAHELKKHRPNLKVAKQTMPPLLRSYLGMGGWVSDHAVVDRGLNTLHVFTGLEVDAIPAARARLLRADANAL